jgi:hypothetical protein
VCRILRTYRRARRLGDVPADSTVHRREPDLAQKRLESPSEIGPDELAARKTLLAEWQAEKEQLEAELVRQVPEMNLERKSQSADRQAVARALPEGAALIEFIRFSVRSFQTVKASGGPLWPPARYLAFVLHAGEPDSVSMIDLEEADEIDRMIANFRASVINPREKPSGRDLGQAPIEPAPPLESTHGADLRAAVFDKLEYRLAGAKRLLLAPGGELTRLPFEILPAGDGRRLIDDYMLSYLGCARDAIRFGTPLIGESSDALIVADPDFDLCDGDPAASSARVRFSGRHSRTLDNDRKGLGPAARLLATRVEGETIAYKSPGTSHRTGATGLRFFSAGCDAARGAAYSESLQKRVHHCHRSRETLSSPSKTNRTVVVTGDVTMDWNLAHRAGGEDAGTAWTVDDFTRACWQRGGAALLADLIEAVASHLMDVDVQVWRQAVPREMPQPGDRRFHHSYAMWSFCEGRAWRVERFLGLDRIAPENAGAEWQRVTDDRANADVVILDDAGLGFRQSPNLWPQAISTPDSRPWVLLKIARPVATGPLWDHLLKSHADRLVVVMTANDLRRSEVQISRRLSWERTAQDVVWELTHNPRVNGLSRCAHIIVSFDTAGGILLSEREGARLDARLIFDPQQLEGGWQQSRPGRMIGNTVTLASAIARQLILKPDAPDLVQAVQAGVAAMRQLFLLGYGHGTGVPPQVSVTFPLEPIAAELSKDESPLAVVAIQDPVRFLKNPSESDAAPATAGLWRILEDRYPMALEEVAEQIVREGVETALQGVPVSQVGGLVTVDRREIEALRSIQNVLAEYCRHRQKRPLSIAVFGPPGSGKSFGVEQVAQSLSGVETVKLEFNLSQFSSPEELYGAFHQVRDAGLKGKTPLVFWDEFDTSLEREELGWLRYFLSPMQDGSFLEGQIVHPIGQCFFVFAGGTSSRMSEFAAGLSPEQRKAAKVPDFVSRLRGFLDVLGPNRQQTDEDADPYFIIRRAILLRSILKRNVPQVFNRRDGKQTLYVDSGVLRGFLQTREFKHGVRSIESIVAMSALSGKSSFDRSVLPAEEQLELHVDAQNFLALVQQIVLTGELLERLAAAAHEVYCAGKKRDGWTYGERNDEKKTHPLLIPYEQLPEWAKEANRVSVRTIPQKLAAAGYVMLPARSNEPALEFPGHDLEELAQLEHELWMEGKLAAGFKAGKPTEEDPKRNEHLVEWDQVAEPIKQIDRDLIRGIPQILARAGYAVEKDAASASGGATAGHPKLEH